MTARIDSICCIFTLSLFGLEASGQAALPFSETFSGHANGAVLQGAGWSTTDNAIVITNNAAHSDTFAARIPSAIPENLISLSFAPGNASIVFVDYYTKLTASGAPSLPLLTTPETSALVSLRPFGPGFAQWTFLDGDGDGGGLWQNGSEVIGVDNSSQSAWHRITMRMNLASGLWDAYVDGVLQAVDLGFAEAMTTDGEAIVFYGGSAGVNYLDSLLITEENPLFEDADQDGLEDSYELAHGLDTTSDDRSLDFDGDGLSNIREYLLGTGASEGDSDGDGLEDGWEANEGYSARKNQGQAGAFGDLDADRLANHVEVEIGSPSRSSNSQASLIHTETNSRNDLAITLIGRGTYTVEEGENTSSLNK